MASVTTEQVLARVIAEYQATTDRLTAQLAAAQARIRELETKEQPCEESSPS